MQARVCLLYAAGSAKPASHQISPHQQVVEILGGEMANLRKDETLVDSASVVTPDGAAGSAKGAYFGMSVDFMARWR
jgi:hypothetical protein